MEASPGRDFLSLRAVSLSAGTLHQTDEGGCPISCFVWCATEGMNVGLSVQMQNLRGGRIIVEACANEAWELWMQRCPPFGRTLSCHVMSRRQRSLAMDVHLGAASRLCHRTPSTGWTQLPCQDVRVANVSVSLSVLSFTVRILQVSCSRRLLCMLQVGALRSGLMQLDPSCVKSLPCC